MTMTSTATLTPGGALSSVPLLVGMDVDQSVEPLLTNPDVDFFDFFMRYSKNYSPEEHAAIKARGKSTGIIWEAGGTNAFLGKQQGQLDAQHLISQFLPGGQMAGITPTGKSAIFLTIDSGEYSDENLFQARWYWYEFDATLYQHSWLAGAYASGDFLTGLEQQKVAYNWVAGAWGWSGTRPYLKVEPAKWHIVQGPTFSGGEWPQAGAIPGVAPITWPDIGIPYDPNIARSLDWAI